MAGAELEQAAKICSGNVDEELNDRLQISGKVYDVSLSEDFLSWKLYHNHPSQSKFIKLCCQLNLLG